METYCWARGRVYEQGDPITDTRVETFKVIQYNGIEQNITSTLRKEKTIIQDPKSFSIEVE